MVKEPRPPFRRRAERPSRQSGAGARIPPHQLTPSQQLQLEALDALCGRLGRTPLREELPPCLRLELTASFGSLRGAFLYLGRVPLSQQEVRELRQGLIQK